MRIFINLCAATSGCAHPRAILSICIRIQIHTYIFTYTYMYQYICRRSWRACTRAMLSCWKWREVQILKSQIAAKDTMSNDCRADFWEFLLAQLDELMTSMLYDLKKVLDTLDTGTHKFSKVSWVVVLHSTLSSELTFENFCRCSMIVWKFWTLSRRMCDMTYVCDMTHMCVTWLICVWHDSYVCDMTHMCVTWLICVWHDSYVTRLIHACTHDSCMCVHMTHACVRIHVCTHDSCMYHVTHACVTWLIHVRHGSCMCDCDMAKSWCSRTCWILSAWVCSFIFDMTP